VEYADMHARLECLVVMTVAIGFIKNVWGFQALYLPALETAVTLGFAPLATARIL
jgi:hypothetical protein